MNHINYNNKLYKKMSIEYDNFIADLKTKSPDIILESAYEKVMKEDLLSFFEYTDFPEKEIDAKALYMLPYPLDALYEAWLKIDLSYMDLLRDTIDKEIECAKKKYIQNKHNKSLQ